jgi:hypothetical protein
MSKQIIVSEGKVLAYGEDCFSVTNDTVKCANTGKVYQNATVVTVEEFPENIDCMCYKYDLGQFKCDLTTPRFYKISRSIAAETAETIYTLPEYDPNIHMVLYVRGKYADDEYAEYDTWSILSIGEVHSATRYMRITLQRNGDIIVRNRDESENTITGYFVVVDAAVIDIGEGTR